MPSRRRIPLQQLGATALSRAPQSAEAAETPRKRGHDEVRVQIVAKRAKEDDGEAVGSERRVEPTVTEEPVDGKCVDASEDVGGVIGATNAEGTSEEKASEPRVRVEADSDSDSANEQDADPAPEAGEPAPRARGTIELNSDSSPSSSEEEAILPHSLTSINHNILGRLASTPFHNRAMKTLFLRAHDRQWDDVVPPLKLPVCGQRRFVRLLKGQLNQKKTGAGSNSALGNQGWKALSSHNANLNPINISTQLTGPEQTQIQQLYQFHTTSHIHPNSNNLSVPTTAHPNPNNQAVPNQNPLIQQLQQRQTANNQANPSVMNNVYCQSVNQTSYSAAPAQQAGYLYPQFIPQAFNNPNSQQISNYQQYRMAMQIAQAVGGTGNASHPSTYAANGPAAPQASASKPIVLSEANKEAVAKLPVAFGFQLNGDNGRSGAHATSASTTAAPPTAPIPQAPASEPTVLNKSNMESMAKLPVAFGFRLNDGQSTALAHSASNAWTYQGRTSLHTAGPAPFQRSTPNKPKLKTPRQSPATTPRASPKLVPTSDHKKLDLPAGWTVKSFLRQGGDSAGTADTYFYSPLTQIKFRSKKSVKLFCGILEECGDNEGRALEVFKERGYKR